MQSHDRTLCRKPAVERVPHQSKRRVGTTTNAVTGAGFAKGFMLEAKTAPAMSRSRCVAEHISLERLMQALVSLDQRVEIVVRPASYPRAGITVAV